MKHATVSVEAFWGGFFLVLGSVLALFSLVMTGMTAKQIGRMTVAAAMSLACGALLSVGLDLEAYGDDHPWQALLATVALTSVTAYVLWIIFCTQRVPDKQGDAGDYPGTEEGRPEPAWRGEDSPDDEVEETEHPEGDHNHHLGNRGETLVQPDHETLADVSQEA